MKKADRHAGGGGVARWNRSSLREETPEEVCLRVWDRSGGSLVFWGFSPGRSRR